MKYLCTFFLLLFFTESISQELKIKKNNSGVFSLGVRNTISMFNDGNSDNRGIGAGGQFRLQLSERVNTDWFLDYINGNISDYAYRNDYHIGWSVLYYAFDPAKTKLLRPYILAGHCFDYTRQTANMNKLNFEKRWSSAVQGGIGSHLALTQKCDLSATLQYMMHVGTNIHAHKNENGTVEFEQHSGLSPEGHLLLTFSINYKLVELW